MDILKLGTQFLSRQRQDAIKSILSDRKSKKISFYGLAGSSVAMLFAMMPRCKQPILVVGEDLDDAGYLYHDLSRILGEEAVLMFPSGYKRDIKYGQIDDPSQILRTEALNHWHNDNKLRFVVSYPDALAERVATREAIEKHTLHLKTNTETDLTETVKWLRENAFVEEDYVYEPGHFAVRGSILDIYGYSNELPFRIDFFGDEIDSIRSFNVETQLSEKRLDEIAITSNVARQSHGESLLDFISPDSIIAARNFKGLTDRVKEIAS
ncbi:MAG: hypothetical protein IJY30_02110 [Muribaculaceae bacterium]|nr:hypothetical protein [Muribaculaceae bacterium]